MTASACIASRVCALALTAALAGCSTQTVQDIAAAAPITANPTADATALQRSGDSDAKPPGMSGGEAAALNLSLGTNEQQAIRLVQSAAPDTPPAPEPETPDLLLARQVRLMIGADPAFVNARVTVEAKASRILLSGEVISRAQGDMLRHDVRLMPGVVGVDGELTIRNN
jgi:hypothetical protein